MGDGTTTHRLTPVQVPRLGGVTAVDAGNSDSLALAGDGTVWSWGYNAFGQLGDGTTTDRLSPVHLTGLSGISAVSAGYLHSLAVDGGGAAWAWGSNGTFGKLGDGTLHNARSPIRVPGLSNVTTISAGGSHSLALGTSATVQESTPGVSFNGWDVSHDVTVSAGTYHSSKTIGDSAAFKFSGGSVTWLTRKGPFLGLATVYIDGVSQGTVDLYAPGQAAFAKTYNGLSTTSGHTIKIVVTGKNASSNNSKIPVDAFQVGTSLTQDSGEVTYDRWAVGNTRSSLTAMAGSYESASVPGSVASFTFTGTGIDWITATGPSYGKADVVIDGVDRGVVDLYAASQNWKVTQSYPGLTSGVHTITIKVLGTKSASAANTRVVVDAFTVVN